MDRHDNCPTLPRTCDSALRATLAVYMIENRIMYSSRDDYYHKEIRMTPGVPVSSLSGLFHLARWKSNWICTKFGRDHP